MRKRVDILGVPVDVVSEGDVLRFVCDRIARRDPAQIVTVNVEYVVRARSDAAFASVLRSADLATPDSVGVVWAMRRNGLDIPERVGGSDLIWSLCDQAAQRGHRVFLLGAGPGVAAEAAERLCSRYPGLIISGTYAGSPDRGERAFIVDLIRQRRADLLFVAFGAPQQDLWISDNVRETGVSVAMGVGGSLDYVAGRAKRAPLWVRQHGFDWLWRLVTQPWRWRRMLALPAFVWYIFRSPRDATVREREGT